MLRILKFDRYHKTLKWYPFAQKVRNYAEKNEKQHIMDKHLCNEKIFFKLEFFNHKVLAFPKSDVRHR